MKNLWFYPILFLLWSFGPGAQTSFIIIGAGFHPGSAGWSYTCVSCEFLPCSWAFETYQQYDSKPGYSFFIGFGKEVRLSTPWSLQGMVRLQHMETPGELKIWAYDGDNPGELVYTDVMRSKLLYTSLRFSLALKRHLTWRNKSWGVWAGGYLRLSVEDCMSFHYRHFNPQLRKNTGNSAV